MGIMASSLLWVMQDLYHPPYDSISMTPGRFPDKHGFQRLLIWRTGLNHVGEGGRNPLDYD